MQLAWFPVMAAFQPNTRARLHHFLSPAPPPAVPTRCDRSFLSPRMDCVAGNPNNSACRMAIILRPAGDLFALTLMPSYATYWNHAPTSHRAPDCYRGAIG